MIICDDREFAFIHIPKCAGTSVRRALRVIDTSGAAFFHIASHPQMGEVHLAHLTLADLATHYPATLATIRRYRSMAIVRDPMERFYSALNQRLREFKHIAQSAISPAMIEAEAQHVIAYLESAPPRLDLEHVHFQRQCEFIELHGERLVDDIFVLTDMAGVARHIARITGVNVDEEKRNRTVELRIGALRPVQRLLLDRYVRWVPSERRAAIRERMVRAGFYQDIPIQRHVHPGSLTERFIREYYARDCEIVEQCSRILRERAA